MNNFYKFIFMLNVYMVVYIHCNHVDHKMLSYLVVLFYDYMAGSSVGIEFMKCQRVSLASHISKMKFFFSTHGLDIKSINVLCK